MTKNEANDNHEPKATPSFLVALLMLLVLSVPVSFGWQMGADIYQYMFK